MSKQSAAKKKKEVAKAEEKILDLHAEVVANQAEREKRWARARKWAALEEY